MSLSSSSKAQRVLDIFERLNKGEEISKREEAEYFQVSKKTIQRDLEEIKLYIDSLSYQNKLELKYNQSNSAYSFNREESSWLRSREVLALIKILLESRAFNRSELDNLLDKLILQSAPNHRDEIKKLINNEEFHYIPPDHNKPLLDIIWDLSQAIRECRLVSLEYNNLDKVNSVKRLVQPLGLMFSEYYFYLIAQFTSGDGYKIPYRLDRIKNYKIKDERFKIPYTDRFEEGEFRQRIQFMTPGQLLKIKFRFSGRSIEAVIDRLPTAKIIKEEKDENYIVSAEVYGEGIKMWLLSQAEFIEVLEPDYFRKEMKETIERMADKY